MLVLIDESGDAGFKLGRGSSEVFVLTAVIFDDRLQAEKAAVELKILKQDLGLNQDYEFHFNNASPRLRISFMRVASNQKFRVRTLVFEKSKIRSDELRTNKEKFYNYAVKLLLKDSRANIKDAHVKIDGQGDRVYKRAMASYLRQQLNSSGNHVISKLKIVDSKTDVLIQLADMISGAIYYSYNGKPKASCYKEIIKSRIENLWVFQ